MKLLNILCIALLTAGVASAVVIDNAPDYRGDENSVHALFENPVAGLPIPLDLILLGFEIGPSNYPLSPVGPQGFYDGLALTHILLPNFIDELPMKKMRIQMEFINPVLGADLFVDVIGNDPLGAVTVFEGGSVGTFDTFHYFDFVIYPNPDSEEIFIANLSDPYNSPRIVEIDTISIPEPASIGLIGLISGGVYFTRRFFIA